MDAYVEINVCPVRSSYALKAMWAYGKNQIVVAPNLEVNAVRIINASSVKAPHVALHEFKPERRVANISANKPESADKLAL